jgi:hypothetical protein
MFDNDPNKTCKSPCSLPMPPGRHTVSTALVGHRSALRIFETPKEADLFLFLARMTGQVQILSEPPAASIVVNGETRAEKTPATLEIPVGKYSIEVDKDGYRRDRQDVEVKDGAFIRISFTLGR